MKWLFDFICRAFRKPLPPSDIPPPLPTDGAGDPNHWTDEDEIRWEISHYGE